MLSSGGKEETNKSRTFLQPPGGGRFRLWDRVAALLLVRGHRQLLLEGACFKPVRGPIRLHQRARRQSGARTDGRRTRSSASGRRKKTCAKSAGKFRKNPSRRKKRPDEPDDADGDLFDGPRTSRVAPTPAGASGTTRSWPKKTLHRSQSTTVG